MGHILNQDYWQTLFDLIPLLEQILDKSLMMHWYL